MTRNHKTSTPPRDTFAENVARIQGNAHDTVARLRRRGAEAQLIAALCAASDAAFLYATTETDAAQRVRWNEEGERLRETAAELDPVAVSQVVGVAHG